MHEYSHWVHFWGFSLVWVLMWFFIADDWIQEYSHWVHLWGFSLVWVLMWSFIVDDWIQEYSQNMHLWDFSPACVIMCFWRLCLLPSAAPQILQDPAWGFCPAWERMWDFSVAAHNTVWSHREHFRGLFGWCISLACSLRLDGWLHEKSHVTHLYTFLSLCLLVWALYWEGVTHEYSQRSQL